MKTKTIFLGALAALFITLGSLTSCSETDDKAACKDKKECCTKGSDGQSCDNKACTNKECDGTSCKDKKNCSAKSNSCTAKEENTATEK